MEKIKKQYGWLTRISAAILGSLFIAVSFSFIYDLYCFPSSFGIMHLTPIPMMVLGYLMLNTAWLGKDPMWFYNAWDSHENSDKGL